MLEHGLCGRAVDAVDVLRHHSHKSATKQSLGFSAHPREDVVRQYRCRSQEEVIDPMAGPFDGARDPVRSEGVRRGPKR